MAATRYRTIVADPQVGDRFVSTDNAGASRALGLGVVPHRLMFVSVSHVYPDHRKVQVCDGELWCSYDDLATYFRPRGQVA